MTTQVPRADKLARFVDHITTTCARDPGRRAALRRGLGRTPEQVWTMHAIVAPWLPERRYLAAHRAAERAFYTVAALIAATSEGEQPDDAGQSLGATLAHAVRQGMNPDTAEKRLHLLVRQGMDGVHQQLPGLVRYIRSLGVAVDWAELITDLSRWGTTRGRDAVAKQWLQDFYRTSNPTGEETK